MNDENEELQKENTGANFALSQNSGDLIETKEEIVEEKEIKIIPAFLPLNFPEFSTLSQEDCDELALYIDKKVAQKDKKYPNSQKTLFVILQNVHTYILKQKNNNKKISLSGLKTFINNFLNNLIIDED